MHLASPGNADSQASAIQASFPRWNHASSILCSTSSKLRSDCRFLKQSPTQFPTGTRALNTNKQCCPSKYLPNPGNSDSGLIHSPQPLPMASDDLTVLLRNARTEMPSNMPSQHVSFTLQLKSCKFQETWHKLGKTTNRSVPTCQKLLVHAYWIGIAYSKESLNYPCFNQSLLSSLPNPNTLPRLQSHWP